MNFDFVSFALGALVTGALWFFGGFIQEFGKYAADKVKAIFFPEPTPPPTARTVRHFDPPSHLAGRCNWVPQDRADEFLDAGFRYYEDGEPPRRIRRQPDRGDDAYEWLMFK